jgi:copper(I)-binding protein
MTDHDGMSMMMTMETLPVPGLATVRLAPGHVHIMLEGLSRAPAAGEELPIVLVFRRAGRLPVSVRVVSYDQLAERFRADDP